jgi:hypothetical protein
MRRARILSLLIGWSFVVASFALTPAVRADDPPMPQERLETYGPGTRADKATAKTVASSIKRFVKLLNARGPAAVDLIDPSEWQGGSRDEEIAVLQRHEEVTLYRVGDVRTHEETGFVSAEMISSGWYTDTSYYTERVFLIYRQATEDYAIKEFGPVPIEAVDPLVAQTVRVTFSEQKLSLKPATVPAATLLVLHAVSNGNRWLSTGVYELPEDLSAQEGQAMVIADFRSLPFLGATPVPAEREQEFGILVEPGKRYLIEEYTLDEHGSSPVPLEGAQYATVLTIRIADSTPDA